MIVLAFDLESTGRDVTKDRIIEFGAVVWNTRKSKIITVYNQLVKPDPCPPLSEEIKSITNIDDEDLAAYGESLSFVMLQVKLLIERYKVEYVFSHNGERFDRPLLLNELARAQILGHPIERLPLVDTMLDLPFKKPPLSLKLNYMAHDHGFINPFPHRAFSDALSMMRIAGEYPIDKILELRNTPFIVLAARVSFEDNSKAKQLGYRWERVEDEIFSKTWVKRVRENEVAAELEAGRSLGISVVKLAVWKRP